MKIVKPGWISHEGEPIYSIDIQRGDLRFVTGGQGANGSGLVIIWNLLPVIDESLDKDSNQPKILSRIENHTSCVNCVRWSENGKFLATAGDDQYTMIWQYAGKNANFSSSFGGKSVNNFETWKSIHVLRGHSGDILHLAWSFNNKYLASCSVDNTIIVWNADKFPAKVATLEGHNGFVKGVAWDPAGKFLASQSADKTVKIWQVSTWSCLKTIKKPFEESGHSTHFLRLDWSSDGAGILSSHAMDNGGPVAKLIQRNKQWSCEREFVGHRKAITCVRFSPTIYQRRDCDKENEAKSKKDKETYAICAVGSKDRSVSVWSTAYLRPVVVLHNIFGGNVMDISWSTKASSAKVLACSSDGSVVLLQFSDGELGRPYSASEKCDLLREKYGDTSVVTNGIVGNHVDDVCRDILEDPRLLKLQNEQQQQAMMSSVSTNRATTIDKPAVIATQQQQHTLAGKENTSDVKQPVSEQVEIRTKDGRRKIQPIFLGSSVVTEDPALKQLDSSDANSTSVATSNKTTDDVVMKTPVKVDNKCDPSVAPSAAIERQTPFVEPAAVSKLPVKPISTASVDTSMLGNRAESPPCPKSVKSKLGHRFKPSPSEKPSKRKRRDRPAILSDDEEEEETNEELNIPTVSSTANNVLMTSASKEAILYPLLAIPKRESTLSISLELVGASRGLAFVRCDNEGVDGTGPRICHVTCMQNRNLLWQNMLNSSAILLAASDHIVAVATADGVLVALSTTNGRHVTPRLVLNSPACRLLCSARYLYAITCKGSVYVWHVEGAVRLVCKDTLSYLLVGDPNIDISKISLADFGDPIVCLSNGKSYVYSSSLSCWVLFGDTNDTLASLSSLKGQIKSSPGNLSCLTPLTPNQFSSPSKKLLSDETQYQLATTACLENLINSSLTMKSVQDYEFWILQYAQELCRDESRVFKLKSLCQDLLNDCRFSNSAEPFKIDKRNLLTRILSIVARNSKLQRVYTEFREQLDTLSQDVDFI